MNRNVSLLLLSGIVSLGAVACGGSQSSAPASGSTAEQAVEAPSMVRFAHFAQAPSVAVTLAGETISDRFEPGAVSDFIEAPAGSHDFVVSSPSGANEFLSSRVAFGAESTFSVLVVGTAAQNSLRTVVIEHENPEPPVEHGSIRFVNGAGGSGVLNFTSGGRGFASGVAFGSASDYTPVRAGATTFETTGGYDTTFEINVAEGAIYTVVAHMNNDEISFTTITE